jgi:ribonuclease-3
VKLPYTFTDQALLDTALTHPSWVNSHPGAKDNQRLELLGDAVAGLIVTEQLYLTWPAWDEGALHRARTAIVSTDGFAALAKEIGLDRALRREAGIRVPGRKILADTFEAVVAAVWLDGGWEAARAFVVPLVADRVAHADRLIARDAKSRLQEWLEARGRPRPAYVSGGTDGPPHALTFRAMVRVGEELFGPGSGRTKRDAETAAATIALAALESGG